MPPRNQTTTRVALFPLAAVETYPQVDLHELTRQPGRLPTGELIDSEPQVAHRECYAALAGFRQDYEANAGRLISSGRVKGLLSTLPNPYRHEKNGGGATVARRQERIMVRISHSCTPDPAKVERGIELWAAYVAENVRNSSRHRGQQASKPGNFKWSSETRWS